LNDQPDADTPAGRLLMGDHAKVRMLNGIMSLTWVELVASDAIRILLSDPAESSTGVVHQALLSRAYRLRDYVRHLVIGLELFGNWECAAAATLSHIGFLYLPVELIVNLCTGGTLSSADRGLLASHAADGAVFLRGSPGLRVVADMIVHQFTPYYAFKGGPVFRDPGIALGAQMLHAAGDLDRLLCSGVSQSDALEEMHRQPLEYNLELLSLLRTFDVTACCNRWNGPLAGKRALRRKMIQ
jgi:hypothetical protein